MVEGRNNSVSRTVYNIKQGGGLSILGTGCGIEVCSFSERYKKRPVERFTSDAIEMYIAVIP